MQDLALRVLGPPETWPPSLRTALTVCFASPTPMQVWWGPQETLFYNAAAIPILGDRHPEAFGRSAPEVWGERWRSLRSGGGVQIAQLDGGILCVHDDLLRSIGHDLRNPLSVLATTIQAMLLTAPSREVDLMARALHKLTWMVEDLLDVSRHARSALTIRLEPVELAQLIDRAIELVSERDTKVFASVPRTGIAIDADRERLARAFANVLTGNSITIEAVRELERVRIVVRGAVIKESLALASARALIDRHGGTLHVSGDGCEIELPIAAAARPAVDVARGTKKRVLIVEDQDDTACSLKHALEQLGYSVAMAHDGPVALHVQRTFDPDVVLLDIGLPVMDGWELATRLRERAREVHFIAVTGRDQLADQERSHGLGFAEHLVKPVDLGRLETLIDALSSPARPVRSSGE